MLKEGIKKEMMFFTRSFRMWGVLLAAVLLAVIAPLLIKLLSVLGDNLSSINDLDFMTATVSINGETDIGGEAPDFDPEIYAGKIGAVSAFGDLTSTLSLIFMLVTMYSAGGELKKRSMIIPQNAGLSSKLYILPKFIVYPLSVAAFAFCGMWIGFGVSSIAFPDVQVDALGVLAASFAAAVYDAFIAVLYFTIGLCTAKAGMSVVIMYGGSSILSALFVSLGADKFHPFTLASQARNAVVEENAFDALNYWGSIGVTVLIMLLCYFVTLFVISARRVDNRGREEMQL